MSQSIRDVGQFFPATMFKNTEFKDYNEAEFIERLTYRLLNEVKKLSDEEQAYSGQLFHDLFQKSVVALDSLMESVSNQTEKLIIETENATQLHKKKLQNLNGELETASERFKNLEDCISKVGNTTVQIGNTLETVDKQKKRAIDAKKLLQYFEEFNRYERDHFENTILPQGKIKFAIFKNKNTQHQAAKIIQQLNSIAKDLVKVPDCENGIANIQLYSSQLLNTLSKNFVQSVRMLETNPRVAVLEMKKRAKILYDVKIGETCVELYVDKRCCKFLDVQDSDDEEGEENVNRSTNSDDSEQETKKKKESSSESEGSEKKSESGSQSDRSDKNSNSDKNEQSSSEKKSESSDNASNSSGSEKKRKKMRKKGKKKSKRSDEDEENKNENGNERATEQETVKESPKALTKEELEVKRIQNYNEVRRSMVQSVTDIKSFKNILNRIQDMCRSENEVIIQVFATNHKDVLLELLRRLLDQIVSKIIDNILQLPNVNHASADDLLSYLVNLENIYKECIQFARDISKDKEMPIAESTVSIMIENMFADKKQNYINVEINHLDKVCKNKMLEIAEEENKILIELAQNKHQTGYFGAFFSSSSAQDSSAIIMQAKTIDKLANNSGYSTNKHIQMPNLKFDVIVTLINESSAALNRCQKLSSPKQLPDNMAKLFEVLVRYVGDYIDRGLSSAMSTLEPINAKMPPRPDMYQTLQMANSMLQKVQQHLEQQVIPIVSISLPVQLQCVKMKDDLYGRLEVKVVRALDVLLRSIMAHAGHIFETESKKTAADYKPKENINLNKIYVDHRATQGCAKVCRFLEAQVQYLSLCLFGRNREMFLSELGAEFYKALTTFLKGFSVNNPGAIVLMRDLSEYQKCMRRFEVQSVDDLFDGLREISNVFLVAPQNLDNVLSQIDQKKMSREEILGFIKMRSDYRTAKLNKLAFLDKA